MDTPQQQLDRESTPFFCLSCSHREQALASLAFGLGVISAEQIESLMFDDWKVCYQNQGDFTTATLAHATTDEYGEKSDIYTGTCKRSAHDPDYRIVGQSLAFFRTLERLGLIGE